MRSWKVLTVVSLAALEWGCLVSIHHVRDPEPAFARARAEAMEAARTPGRPHHLSVLAYDADEQELVEVHMPLWLLRRAHVDEDLDLDDPHADRIARHLKGRLRLADLEKAGRGVLVEVEEKRGEQVLVWLH